MANKKITELTAASALVAADVIAAVTDVSGTPTTKKATIQKILDLAGNVVGPSSSPNDPGYAFPIAMFADATGELLKSYSDVWYWSDGTVKFKNLSIGGYGVVNMFGTDVLQFTGYGNYFIKDAINEPSSSANLGVLAANGNHYPFVKGSMQSLHLGYTAGDASVSASAGEIKLKDSTPLKISTTDRGVELNTTGTKPTASSTYRGQLFLERGGAGVADVLYMCMKDAADAYSWVVVKSA